jgi:hypothetical protein
VHCVGDQQRELGCHPRTTTTTRKRKRRPLVSVAEAKSSDQRWFGPCGSAIGPRVPNARLRSMRLSSFDRPVATGSCQYVLTLGQVSSHLLHSGKTHESRAMNALPNRARAAASPSFWSEASAPAPCPPDRPPAPPERLLTARAVGIAPGETGMAALRCATSASSRSFMEIADDN